MSDDSRTETREWSVTTDEWTRALSSKGPGRRLSRRERLGLLVWRARRALAQRIDPDWR